MLLEEPKSYHVTFKVETFSPLPLRILLFSYIMYTWTSQNPYEIGIIFLSHFTDEETGPEMPVELHKITHPVGGRGRIWT